MRIVAATIWKFNLDIHLVQSHAHTQSYEFWCRIFCQREQRALYVVHK